MPGIFELDPSELFHPTLARTLEDLADRLRLHLGPRVLIVPGLSGSQLGRRGFLRDETLWFDIPAAREGRIRDLALGAPVPPIEPLAIFEPIYRQMIFRLQLAGYDVGTHPYDFRLSLRDLGAQLAARIAKEGREVHLIGHSYGAQVARAAIAAGATNVGKVIMLGASNDGSFAMVQALRGKSWVVHVLSALDGGKSPVEIAQEVLQTWPSVYESIPMRGDLDLHDPARWPTSGAQPRAELLRAARTIRDFLAPATADYHFIAGVGEPTIVRASVDGGGFRYERDTGGDGFVTTDSAVLPGHPVHYVAAAHIGMPNNGAVLDAVEDILSRGDTDRLPREAPEPSPAAPISEADPDDEPFDGRRGSALTIADMADLYTQFAVSIASFLG